MRNGAVFKPSLVIITVWAALIGCSSKHENRAKETTFIEEGKPVRRTKLAGIVTCEGRISPQTKEPLDIPQIELNITQPAQKVLRHMCQGDAVEYTEFSPVGFDLSDMIGSRHADILIVRNLTTCSERVRSYGSEIKVLESMGKEAASMVPLNEVRQVAVLPLGNEQMDFPSDLALDPTRPNILEVEMQICETWTMEGDLRVCEKAVPIFKRQVAVNVKFLGRYLRMIRVEKETCS